MSTCSQSFSGTPLSLQTRRCTGLEMSMSTSTVLFTTRGESLMSDTCSGGTWAGTTLKAMLVLSVCINEREGPIQWILLIHTSGGSVTCNEIFCFILCGESFVINGSDYQHVLIRRRHGQVELERQ